MKIHYITQWGENSIGRTLTYSPAAITKMKYLVTVMEDCADKVCISSFSSGGKKFNGIYFPKKVKYSAKSEIRYCATWGATNKYLRIIERISNCIQLFLYFLFSVKKSDLIVIYHERYYAPIITFVRRLLRYKIIYEVEEIYTVAANYSQRRIKKEIERLKCADGYILINDVIYNQCGLDTRHKPFVVFYGVYNHKEMEMNKFPDDKIHLLYAGTLNKTKGGARNAIECIRYLPANYHLHILGFGTQEQINEIKDLIVKTNAISSANASYDGILSGKEYLNFLDRCHIGLSTQNSGLYNNTSFPSKILSYMSCGLSVVSTRLKVLEVSAIDNMITYCEDNNPQALADAIVRAKFFKPEILRKKIKELDKNFRRDFEELIKKI